MPNLGDAPRVMIDINGGSGNGYFSDQLDQGYAKSQIARYLL